MIIQTVQMCHWRKVRDSGLFLLDSTTKTGDKVFAPGWDIVLGIKDGSITEEQYRLAYTDRMRQSYRTNKEHWLSVLKQPSVVIGCYCKAHTFCHRYLLVEFFHAIAKQEGIECRYAGELYTDGK